MSYNPSAPGGSGRPRPGQTVPVAQYYGDPVQPVGVGAPIPIQPYQSQYGAAYSSGAPVGPDVAYGSAYTGAAATKPISPDVAYGSGGSGQYYTQDGGGFVEIDQGNKPLTQSGPSPYGERFNQPPKYNDVIFAVLFIIHLAVLVIIAISSTGSGGSSGGGGTSMQSLIPSSEIATLAGIMVTVAVIGLIVAGLWIVFFKRYASALIHFTMIAGIIFLGAGAVVFLAMGNTVGGIFMFIGCLLNGLFYFFARRRIPFAALILKSVGQLVQMYPQTVFVALGSVVAGVIFLVLWSYTVALSAGNLDNGYFIQAFLLLSCYWSMQVIKNVVHVTVSGTFAAWYFLQGSESMPPRPIMGALRRALTYSFGSICFGSLVVAIIKTIRVLVRQAMDRDNIFRCIVDCLIGCLDRLVQYFNSYAYIFVAMYGQSFIQAAKSTWALIKRRAFDAIVNDNLIDGVLIMGAVIGGIVTALVGGGWAYASMNQVWYWVAFLAFVIGFAMVMIVMQVVDSGVKTLFVCLAEEPGILKMRNPELFNKFQEVYNLDLA